MPYNNPFGKDYEYGISNIQTVANAFSECYRSKCYPNFTFSPTDIRYYDKFILMSTISVFVEKDYKSKKFESPSYYIALLELYVYVLQDFFTNSLIKNLFDKIDDEMEKIILQAYVDHEIKEIMGMFHKNRKILIDVQSKNKSQIYMKQSKFDYELEDILKIIWVQFVAINGFIVDIYTIMCILSSNDDIFVGYYGIMHVDNIFDFFMKLMENNTKLITINDPENIIKNAGAGIYPSRCLHNLSINIDFE